MSMVALTLPHWEQRNHDNDQVVWTTHRLNDAACQNRGILPFTG